MNPYKELGVSTDATAKQIKNAYRKLSVKHHPDKEGGDREKFESIKLAYDVLIDPARRERYDKFGRLDDNPITPEKIRSFLVHIVKEVVNAVRQDGTTDDPEWDNIRDKVLLSISAARVPLRRERNRLEARLKRAQSMLARFKTKQKEDLIGDILREEIKDIQREIDHNSDLMELSTVGETVFKGYDYDVGPGPEGHSGSPGPTDRRVLIDGSQRMVFTSPRTGP